MRRMEEREEMREEKEKSCPLVKKSVSDSEREVMSVVGFRCTVVEKDCIWLNKGWRMTSANMKGKTDEERTRYVNK